MTWREKLYLNELKDSAEFLDKVEKLTPITSEFLEEVKLFLSISKEQFDMDIAKFLYKRSRRIPELAYKDQDLAPVGCFSLLFIIFFYPMIKLGLDRYKVPYEPSDSGFETLFFIGVMIVVIVSGILSTTFELLTRRKPFYFLAGILVLLFMVLVISGSPLINAFIDTATFFVFGMLFLMPGIIAEFRRKED